LQDLRTHEIAVEEVPAFACQPGGVLVRTLTSPISSSTEGATVKLGSVRLAGKVLERPDLVNSLFQPLQTTGASSVIATVRAGTYLLVELDGSRLVGEPPKGPSG
jgi:hypothetical protein